MKIILSCCLLLLSSLASADQYGAPISAGPAVSLDTALTELADKNNNHVIIEGTVVSVCQAKGCWMGLQNSTGEVRVTFKDYGFFVPLTIVGKTVQVEGDLAKIQLSLDETKHYVLDAGGDPNSVTEGKTEYRLIASGVKVL